MTYLHRLDAATGAGWRDLIEELDRWEEAGRVATLWWRDDDAVAATPELEALLRLAGDVPLALAVIPGPAEPSLPTILREKPNIAVLQHGWRHSNHAVDGKKSEFPATRAPADVAADLAAGRARLEALFGAQFVPTLAPPWNRYAADLLPLLPAAGIASLSVMAGGPPAMGESGVSRVDAHVDLIAWKAGRGFVGPEAALGLLVGHLHGRRLGAAKPAEATGILTHHLVMDSAASTFLEQLLAVVARHRGARWTAASELWART